MGAGVRRLAMNQPMSSRSSRITSCRRATAPFGHVEKHELRRCAPPVEGEADKGLDRVLLFKAALRLDETLHIDLGDRGHQLRVLDSADGRPISRAMEDYLGHRSEAYERLNRLVNSLSVQGESSLAALTVALRQVRGLVS